MLNVAVVGVGGWGKNLARNYFQIPDCSLKYMCDLSPRRLEEMVHTGELGAVYYVYNRRVTLGAVRNDENALWSFAPHDISALLYLLGKEPTDVTARGQSYLRRGIEDVVFITLNFDDAALAHIHVSWLDPHKIR